MGLQMVDGDERFGLRHGDGLGGHDADQQSADQTGSGGCRHRVDVVERQAGLVQGLLDQAIEGIDMGARGNLGHNAAIGRMRGQLRQDDIAADDRLAICPALDNRCGGLVA